MIVAFYLTPKTPLCTTKWGLGGKVYLYLVVLMPGGFPG